MEAVVSDERRLLIKWFFVASDPNGIGVAAISGHPGLVLGFLGGSGIAEDDQKNLCCAFDNKMNLLPYGQNKDLKDQGTMAGPSSDSNNIGRQKPMAREKGNGRPAKEEYIKDCIYIDYLLVVNLA